MLPVMVILLFLQALWLPLLALAIHVPLVQNDQVQFQASGLEGNGTTSTSGASLWFADQSSAAFLNKATSLSAQGYRIISLSLYGNSHQYASVWVQRASGQQVYITESTGTQFDAWLAKYSALGYVPTLVTATGQVGVETYAGVMEKGLNIDWSFRRDMTPDTFWHTCDYNYDYERRRLVSFKEYGVPNGESRFCALWHTNPNFDKEFIWTADRANMGSMINGQWTKPFWHPSYTSVSDTERLTYSFSDMSIDLAQGPLSPVIYRATLLQIQNLESSQLQYGRHLIHLQGVLTDYYTGTSLFYGLWSGNDQPSPRQWKVTGPAAHGFKNNAGAITAIDNIMKSFMQKTGVRQAQLAIGKAGDIMLSRAYSWSEYRTTQTSDTFLLASLSKMFCAAAIQAAFDAGLISKATRPWDDFATLPWKMFHFPPLDPRIKDITVEDLLNHGAGWNRNAHTDPDLEYQMRAIANYGPSPATIDDFVVYLNHVMLDFDPGTGTAYSNTGYIVLSKVIETASGMAYMDFLKSRVLTPMGLSNAVKLWSSDPAQHIQEPVTQENRGVGLTADHPSSSDLIANVFSGDGMHKETVVGAGTLAASAETLVKFVAKHAAWGTGPRCAPCSRDGLMAGCRTWAESRVDRLDWAVVLNTDELPAHDGSPTFDDLIASVRTWLDAGQVP